MHWDRRSLLVSSASGLGLVSLGGIALWAKNSDTAPIEPIPFGESFPKIPIGMNLSGISDWDPGFPFKNLFWGARPWMTENGSGKGPWNTGSIAKFEFDPDGYPLEAPIIVPEKGEKQVPFTLIPNVRPPGTYVLLYEGEGEIVGKLGAKVLSVQPGRVVLELKKGKDPKYGIVIKRSVRGNHIRDVRLVALEYERDDLKDDPFLPEFLDFCRPFHCLRFMEWGATNNSLQERWHDRKRPTFYTMTAKTGDPEGKWRPPPSEFERLFAGGVAYEIMIELCNKLKTDMWICIPHCATDDYMLQLAKLVRERLDPSLKLYLEYSNEIWNWQFHQAGWMLQSPLAGALVEANGGFPWKNPDRTDGKDHPERIGALFRRAFSIWEREWANERDRLIRVCSLQVGWPDTAKRTIRWCMEHGGADVIAPTAYFGPSKGQYAKWETAGSALTADVVIDDMFDVLREIRSGGRLVDVVAFGKTYDLPYVAYEGGQHIQPQKQKELPYNPALAAAQAHPRMADLYLELIRVHRDLGCQMLAHFSSIGKQGTRWGSWGAKASYSIPDDESPKMKTLLACNIARS